MFRGISCGCINTKMSNQLVLGLYDSDDGSSTGHGGLGRHQGGWTRDRGEGISSKPSSQARRMRFKDPCQTPYAIRAQNSNQVQRARCWAAAQSKEYFFYLSHGDTAYLLDAICLVRLYLPHKRHMAPQSHPIPERRRTSKPSCLCAG